MNENVTGIKGVRRNRELEIGRFLLLQLKTLHLFLKFLLFHPSFSRHVINFFILLSYFHTFIHLI